MPNILVVSLFHYVNDDLNVMTAMTVANDAGIKMINYKEQHLEITPMTANL